MPEVDYLVTKYLGERVAQTFLEDLKEGYFDYINIELEQIDKITKLMKRYQDLPLGFVDASLVILYVRQSPVNNALLGFWENSCHY